jgi:decaprenylphospho-beta-D-erythro-pentofuranosid-2-ulose 2-reductase
VLAPLLSLAARLASQGAGSLAGCIAARGRLRAADRGRRSKNVYGAAQASVGVLAADLRHQLAAKGARLLTIRPGFADTPMTAGFRAGPLWAGAEKVGAGIQRAMGGGFGVGCSEVRIMRSAGSGCV